MPPIDLSDCGQSCAHGIPDGLHHLSYHDRLAAVNIRSQQVGLPADGGPSGRCVYAMPCRRRVHDRAHDVHRMPPIDLSDCGQSCAHGIPDGLHHLSQYDRLAAVNIRSQQVGLPADGGACDSGVYTMPYRRGLLHCAHDVHRMPSIDLSDGDQPCAHGIPDGLHNVPYNNCMAAIDIRP
jgi:hypothetical protein